MQPESRSQNRPVHCRGAVRAGAGAGRRAGGAARAVRPGHRRDAGGPGAGRLADVAAHARRLGLQPPRPDRHRQRRRAAPGLVPGAERRQPGGDAAGLRRRPLHAEPARRHPGHRRGDGRPAVGVPPRAAGRRRRLRRRVDGQPEHRDLRAPRHRHEHRRLPLRPSTPRPATSSGRPRSSITRSTRPATRRAPSSPAARRSPAGAAGRGAGPRRASSPPTTRRPAPRSGGGAWCRRRASRGTRRGAAFPSRSACTSGRGWRRATTPG